MTILTCPELASLAQQAPRDARLMGIDPGTKTLGLALSDVEWRLASPLKTILRRKFTQDMEALSALAEDLCIFAFVIGLPIEMSGEEGPRAQSVRSFVRLAAPRLSRPFLFWDERLSTQAMERMMIEADVSRRRRAAAIDRMAAAYILQGALDAIQTHDNSRNAL
jgi:putative holliday junction resolvase